MKPTVICHMMSSVDGRILPHLWFPPLPENSHYERLHAELRGDAWLVGRVTGQEFALREAPYPAYTGEPLGREGWLAQPAADQWAVVLDAHGKIAWGRNELGGDPLVVLLTQTVPDSHLAGLRADGVSYLFAGEREIDLAAAMETLYDRLGIRRLLLEGGGAINGAMFRAGLINALSLIIAPAVEGVVGGPSVFDFPSDAAGGLDMWDGQLMRLSSCRVLDDGFVRLFYIFFGAFGIVEP
jgi:riboflavin biosynthesis pyrimidine reductase